MFTAFAVGLSLTANVMAQVPSYVPTNGLVGWWPFNANANDESGNGNNGTVNGATLTTDRFGNASNAYSFDGLDDFIELVQPFFNGSNTVSDFTISLWINQAELPSYYYHVLGFSSYWKEKQLQIGSQGDLNFSGSNNSGYFGTPTISSFNSLNTWSHILVTYNQSYLRIKANLIDATGGSIPYSNLDFSVEISGNSTGKNQIGCINSVSNGNYSFFNGKIDDIGIWNRLLSDQEISNLYVLQTCSNDLTISPTLNTQNISGNATFTATTSDSSPSYIWQSDFGQGFQTLNNYGNYSGATSNSLTISNVQLANHNQPIRAISTSGDCVDTSNIATIQIADTCITNVTVYDTLLTTITDTLIINTTLSLPAPNNENTILIYPNPASDHITIDNGNFAAMAGYSIKIENNAGQQVFQSLINQAQFYLDLSTWSGNGLYFVHLIDPQNNTVTVRKIVLQ